MAEEIRAFTASKDLKLSQLGSVATGYLTGTQATVITLAGTFYKVNAVFTEKIGNGISWNGVDNRWDYAGPDTHMTIIFSFSGSHDDAVATRECKWAIWHNGVAVADPPKVVNIIKSGANSVVVMSTETIVDGDYIELAATIDSAGETINTSGIVATFR
jgi:hypothetical protein